MSYSISEENRERQRSLAEVLNPFTEPYLAALEVDRDGRWLDVGAGLGETTRLLARFLGPDGECVGIELDPALVEAARETAGSERSISFRQGDATSLPFEDDTFDLVYARYLLVHLPDPLAALREFRRVAKPGGVVLVQEPDFAFNCCYPPSPGYARLPELLGRIFADGEIGRKLVHHFREAGMGRLGASADIGIETDGTLFRRVYTLTFEAIGEALVQAGHLTAAEYASLLASFREVEEDPGRVLIANPVVTIQASI